MNRRGQVALILLPIVALIFSLIMLYVFASFDGSFDSKSEDYSSLMNEVNFFEDYVVKKGEIIVRDSLNCDKEIYEEICDEKDIVKRIQGISVKHDLQLTSQGNFFAKLRNEEFEFNKEGEDYKLIVKDLFVQSERKGRKVGEDYNINKVRRNFDLELNFDSNGVVKDKETKAAQGL